jgi:uncharacterized repeat protein (TIGR02543 family)
MRETSRGKRIYTLLLSMLISVALSLFIVPFAQAANSTESQDTSSHSTVSYDSESPDFNNESENTDSSSLDLGAHLGSIVYKTGMPSGVTSTTIEYYERHQPGSAQGSPCAAGDKAVESEWCKTHTFMGWTSHEGSQVVEVSAGQKFDAIPYNTTFYAVWDSATTDTTNTNKTYVMQYNGNGDDDNSEYVAYWITLDDAPDYVMTLDSGEKLHREGYTFQGWNTEPDGSGTAMAAGSSRILDGSYRLYAQWTKNVDETTDPADPDTTKTDPADPDTTKTDPTNPTDPDTTKTDGSSDEHGETGTTTDTGTDTGTTDTHEHSGGASTSKPSEPTKPATVPATPATPATPVETVIQPSPAQTVRGVSPVQQVSKARQTPVAVQGTQKTKDAQATTVILAPSAVTRDENREPASSGSTTSKKSTETQGKIHSIPSGDAFSKKSPRDKDLYSKMHVEQGSAPAPVEAQVSDSAKKAGTLAVVASVLFVGVAVSVFPIGSAVGTAGAAAGGAKLSMLSKFLHFLRH